MKTFTTIVFIAGFCTIALCAVSAYQSGNTSALHAWIISAIWCLAWWVMGMANESH